MNTSRMNISGLCVFALAILTVFTAAGCGENGGGLTAVSNSPVSDVPIPTDFELEELRSRSWTDGSLRFVDHLYSGRGDKFVVGRFYERQMPPSRWTPLTNQLVQGRATLDFVKDQEKCRITIYDGNWGYTYIHVTIWPSRGAAVKPPKK